jgi:hypothetical protein
MIGSTPAILFGAFALSCPLNAYCTWKGARSSQFNYLSEGRCLNMIHTYSLLPAVIDADKNDVPPLTLSMTPNNSVETPPTSSGAVTTNDDTRPSTNNVIVLPPPNEVYQTERWFGEWWRPHGMPRIAIARPLLDAIPNHKQLLNCLRISKVSKLHHCLGRMLPSSLTSVHIICLVLNRIITLWFISIVSPIWCISCYMWMLHHSISFMVIPHHLFLFIVHVHVCGLCASNNIGCLAAVRLSTTSRSHRHDKDNLTDDDLVSLTESSLSWSDRHVHTFTSAANTAGWDTSAVICLDKGARLRW